MADGIIKEVGDAVEGVVEDVRGFLTSEDGKRLRRTVATGLITLAPVIAALPPVRVSRFGRVIGFAGGAAFIVKVAEVIRDWEPGQTSAEA